MLLAIHVQLKQEYYQKKVNRCVMLTLNEDKMIYFLRKKDRHES